MPMILVMSLISVFYTVGLLFNIANFKKNVQRKI